LVLDRRGGGDVDVESVGRWDGHDGPAGLHQAGRGRDGDGVLGPLDARHHGAQPDTVAQFGGHPGRHLVTAVREVVLLRTTDGVEHTVQAAGGLDVAQGV
jgi:hypothetical protein